VPDIFHVLYGADGVAVLIRQWQVTLVAGHASGIAPQQKGRGNPRPDCLSSLFAVTLANRSADAKRRARRLSPRLRTVTNDTGN
jgi:hypothetical protein